MVKEVLIAITQATSLPHVGRPLNTCPKFPGTAEEDPILTQRSPRDQPDNAGKVDQAADAGRPTIAPAKAHPETTHVPKDPSTVSRDAAQHPMDTNKIALMLVSSIFTLTV